MPAMVKTTMNPRGSQICIEGASSRSFNFVLQPQSLYTRDKEVKRNSAWRAFTPRLREISNLPTATQSPRRKQGARDSKPGIRPQRHLHPAVVSFTRRNLVRYAIVNRHVFLWNVQLPRKVLNLDRDQKLYPGQANLSQASKGKTGKQAGGRAIAPRPPRRKRGCPPHQRARECARRDAEPAFHSRKTTEPCRMRPPFTSVRRGSGHQQRREQHRIADDHDASKQRERATLTMGVHRLGSQSLWVTTFIS